MITPAPASAGRTDRACGPPRWLRQGVPHRLMHNTKRNGN
jgi:hypothetical protein